MNPQLQEFCQRWIDKSNDIDGNDLRDLFDKFFSLYVAYNRLYVEATHILNHRGNLNIDANDSFPDKNAATSYILQYFGCRRLKNILEENGDYTQHLNSLKNILRNNIFNVCLNPLTGNSIPQKDQELLSKLDSNNCNDQVSGILEFIYQVRCNMFHGRKGYEPVQEILLEPVLYFLNKIVLALFNKLQNENP